MHGADDIGFGASADKRLKFAKMALFVDMHTPVEEGKMPPLYPPHDDKLQVRAARLFLWPQVENCS